MSEPIARVWCNCQVEGFHCWAEAPSEVSFLRNEHRHVFHIRPDVFVSHNDRAVEFILLKRLVEKFFVDNPISGGVSCEMIAQQLGNFLNKEFKVFSVSVSEDGENGSIVEW